MTSIETPLKERALYPHGFGITVLDEALAYILIELFQARHYSVSPKPNQWQFSFCPD
jgi:hypothetical protein